MALRQPDIFGNSGAVDAYGGSIKANAPIAANADPLTSHEAGERHNESGKRDRHKKIAWVLVMAMPGKTAHELWAGASEREQDELGSYHELYRRLSDLRNEGAIKQTAPRRCSVKGTRMVTWEPA